jgi:hypothetical protein
MFSHALSLSAAVPIGVLDMTADFAPLFMGLVVAVGLGILGLAVAVGWHDYHQAQREASQQVRGEVVPLKKAA